MIFEERAIRMTSETKTETLRRKIESAINQMSAENGSNTPDFILAEYLTDCLAAFDKATMARDRWYGVPLRPGSRLAGDGTSPDLAKADEVLVTLQGTGNDGEIAKAVVIIRTELDRRNAVISQLTSQLAHSQEAGKQLSELIMFLSDPTTPDDAIRVALNGIHENLVAAAKKKGIEI